MGKITSDVSADRGGLHMKMVVDTTETKKYAKQIPDAYETVAKNNLMRFMLEVMKETQAILRGNKSYSLAEAGMPQKWEIAKSQMKSNMFKSDEGALSKIAASLKVADTRSKTGGTQGGKGSASVSMWSQDEDRKGDFTSAGVRGSRARSGKQFEGKIAQYYEQGRGKFGAEPGDGKFEHPGFKKIGYMAKAREKVLKRFTADPANEMERKMKPGAEYATKGSGRQVTSKDVEKAMKAYGGR